MKKRGSSQVDWAISLAMFLLYLAWFFILAKPNLVLDSDIGGLAESLMDDIVDNTTWTVTRIPVFFNASVNDANEPAILDFPFDWSNGTFTITPERYFTRADNSLFSIKTVNGSFTLWLLQSQTQYSTPFFSKDLEADETYVRIAGEEFDMTISNSTIAQIDHQDITAIENFNIYSNAVPLNVTNNYFLVSPVIARYKVVTDLLNQTMLVFPEHSRVFIQYEMATDFEHTLTLELETNEYPRYYIDTDHLGIFNYSSTECVSATGQFVDLYGTIRGLAISNEKQMDIRLCPANETTLLINVSMTTGDDFELSIAVHPGDYESVLNYTRPEHISTGVSERLRGLNSSALLSLGVIDYDTMKDDFNFPLGTEFSIKLRNSSNDVVFSYSDPVPLETDTVIVRQKKVFMLEDDGTLDPHTLAVSVW